MLLLSCLSTDTNHCTLLLDSSDHIPLLGAPWVGINSKNGADAGLVLLAILTLIGAANRRNGRGRRIAADGGSGSGTLLGCGVGAVSRSPCLLQDRRVDTGSVVSGNG